MDLKKLTHTTSPALLEAAASHFGDVEKSQEPYAGQSYYSEAHANELLEMVKQMLAAKQLRGTLKAYVFQLTPKSLRTKLNNSKQYLVAHSESMTPEESAAVHGMGFSIKGETVVVEITPVYTAKKFSLAEAIDFGGGSGKLVLTTSEIKDLFAKYVDAGPDSDTIFEHSNCTFTPEDVEWFRNRLEVLDSFGGKVDATSIKVCGIPNL